MEKFDFEEPKPWEKDIRRAAEEREAKLREQMEKDKQQGERYEAQLEHIHKKMIQQDGCENILKLAEAERIITRLKERRFD